MTTENITLTIRCLTIEIRHQAAQQNGDRVSMSLTKTFSNFYCAADSAQNWRESHANMMRTLSEDLRLGYFSGANGPLAVPGDGGVPFFALVSLAACAELYGATLSSLLLSALLVIFLFSIVLKVKDLPQRKGDFVFWISVLLLTFILCAGYGYLRFLTNIVPSRCENYVRWLGAIETLVLLADYAGTRLQDSGHFSPFTVWAFVITSALLILFCLFPRFL